MITTIINKSYIWLGRSPSVAFSMISYVLFLVMVNMIAAIYICLKNDWQIMLSGTAEQEKLGAVCHRSHGETSVCGRHIGRRDAWLKPVFGQLQVTIMARMRYGHVISHNFM